MGCSQCGPPRTLDEFAKGKVEELFKKLDQNGDETITKNEAQQFFKSFGKVNVKALFHNVDGDSNGSITKDEFVRFWEQVRKSGYSDKEIAEEIQGILNGGDWVSWDDGNTMAFDSLGKLNIGTPAMGGNNTELIENNATAIEKRLDVIEGNSGAVLDARVTTDETNVKSALVFQSFACFGKLARRICAPVL